MPQAWGKQGRIEDDQGAEVAHILVRTRKARKMLMEQRSHTVWSPSAISKTKAEKMHKFFIRFFIVSIFVMSLIRNPEQCAAHGDEWPLLVLLFVTTWTTFPNVIDYFNEESFKEICIVNVFYSINRLDDLFPDASKLENLEGTAWWWPSTGLKIWRHSFMRVQCWHQRRIS